MSDTILTIISLSASGSVLALVLFALRPFLKNKVSKTFRYYIWLLVLLRLAIPLSFDGSIMSRIISQTAMPQGPVASAPSDSGEGMRTQGEASQGNEQNTMQEITPSGTALNGSAVPAQNRPATSKPTRFDVWEFALDHLTFIWLLGAALYFGWFIIAYLRFSRKISKTSVRPHPKDMEVFTKLRGNSRVRLVCNPYIDTPMLIGFLSPHIVIPRMAFVANGRKGELRHILRHELTHHRRRDLLYKWLVVFVSALHWFNPLMIPVRREISRTCELSCDEAVIRSLDAGGRQDYGETLLVIASNRQLSTGIVTTTMCEGKRELKERLESIMKYKRKSVLTVALSLVLALLLAGCSVALGAATVTTRTPADEEVQTAAATNAPGVSTEPSDEALPAAAGVSGGPTAASDEASQSPAATDATGVSAGPSATAVESKATEAQNASDNPVLEAYNSVLRNNAEYFSTDNNKKLYLNDFLTNKEIYGTDFDVTHFSVLDMDGDNVPEVVLELSVVGEPQFYEVLHYMNGEVYGYLVTYRGLEGLKADGTFSFSSGAADNGWGRLIFGSNACTTDTLAYSESSQDSTGLTIAYFIDNEPVEKEAFDAFTNEQTGKKDAVWSEFSQKNIETELSADS